MRNFKTVCFWIKNIFTVKLPNLAKLDYADYIIEDKSYLIFSWSMENAHWLKIKSLKYKSFLKSGSAYIAINGNVDQLEIIISNSWRSRKYLLKLHQVSINEPIEFPATLQVSFEAKIVIPNPKQKFSKLKLNYFKANLVDERQIKRIINISYPN
ncbi:hypothetical protein [Pedobacter mendelii]|uniref:Uncharacterized protein n=1 Tax=Pedobacter mendelii TaxID=1908240 RepID=A0ABQ2BD05_9SPHI|nr:hypothetical protein [Pedobacter mendelii]GGI23269.1 hypothetical protein GCM10008119_06820 [Pedobacter mendelii]